MSQAQLELHGLCWRTGGRQVLRDVALALHTGEVVGLLGPNGSGKSSVLRALLGLVRPNAGQLQAFGRPCAFGDGALRRRLGVVFQGPSLDGKLTCAQNLYLSAQLYGLSRRAAHGRVAAALCHAELEGRASDRAERLSGGMRRRLELARALLHGPAMLLLDEPTQGLDPLAQQALWQRLDDVRRRDGVSVLMSTHDAEEAARCSRVVVLVEGAPVAYDTPAALLARVGGDVVLLQGVPGVAPAALAQELHDKLGVAARIEGSQVLVEKSCGPSWVPRLVEALGFGRLRRIEVRRPTMADAFFAVTGRALRPLAAASAAEERR